MKILTAKKCPEYEGMLRSLGHEVLYVEDGIADHDVLLCPSFDSYKSFEGLRKNKPIILIEYTMPYPLWQTNPNFYRFVAEQRLDAIVFMHQCQEHRWLDETKGLNIHHINPCLLRQVAPLQKKELITIGISNAFNRAWAAGTEIAKQVASRVFYETGIEIQIIGDNNDTLLSSLNYDLISSSKVFFNPSKYDLINMPLIYAIASGVDIVSVPHPYLERENESNIYISNISSVIFNLVKRADRPKTNCHTQFAKFDTELFASRWNRLFERII